MEATMIPRIAIRTSTTIAAAALFAALLTPAAPVEAKNKTGSILGGIGVVLGTIMNEAAKGMPQQRQPQRGSGGGGGGGGRKQQSSDGDDDEEKAAEAKPKVNDDAVANYVKVMAEREALERQKQEERKRSIDTAVTDFLNCLQLLHSRVQTTRAESLFTCSPDATREFASEFKSQRGVANARGSNNGNVNQVTSAEVRRAVETAYRQAGLEQFDRLPSGEIWTRDR